MKDGRGQSRVYGIVGRPGYICLGTGWVKELIFASSNSGIAIWVPPDSIRGGYHKSPSNRPLATMPAKGLKTSTRLV